MGAFYATATVICEGPPAIVEHVQASQTPSFVVADGRNPTVIAMDENIVSTPSLLGMYAEWLSNQTHCSVFGVIVHDDDVMSYVLAEDGRLVDGYSSNPGYFEGKVASPRGGHADILAAAFGAEGATGAIEEILRRAWNPDSAADGPFFTFETDRHRALVRELGLPEWSAGFGYRYIAQGACPEGLDPSLLMRIN